jgi:ATP-dependent Lhr-like helicase
MSPRTATTRSAAPTRGTTATPGATAASGSVTRFARIEEWFDSRGWAIFDFQRELWQAYLNGESGLLHAPTGSGKTLAVWLGPLIEGLEQGKRPGPRVLWITPLRALANDTTESLQEAIAGLRSDWTVAMRTGDTTSAQRRRQKLHPPSALVTTPESLSVLLSAADTEMQLRTLDAVIVDEWHELMGSKRGTQLELCLAHLRRLNPKLRTWGLSATLGNLTQARDTLLGPQNPGRLVCGPAAKRIEIDSLVPPSIERFSWAGHLGVSLVDSVIKAIDRARSTLLFTNTRSQAEIWYQAIVERRLDWLTCTALHHGSIGKSLRAKIEDALRAGDLKCVVCTSSLDLGVDFSPVDQVIQVGSPKGVARLLQRAGRSGHQPGAVSRVLCVPTHSLELMEIAGVRDAQARGHIESREPLTNCLDVLVQHLMTLACGPGFEPTETLQEVRTSAAYAQLPDLDWQWALDFLQRGGPALRAYPQYRRIVFEDGMYKSADARLTRNHRTSIGTITSDDSMQVRYVSGKVIGYVEESFISRLKENDVFLFSGRTLQLARVKDMTAYVRASNARTRNVPRWQGGRMPLSTELADSMLRLFSEGPSETISPELQALQPILRLQREWSQLPTQHELLIELSRSREGSHIFIYPFAGRLAHEGLATLIAMRLSRLSPVTFTLSFNDYGFELLSSANYEVDHATLRAVLRIGEVVPDLLACLNASEGAKRAFRDIARIAGLVSPGLPGRAKSSRQLQASTGLIYEVLRQFDPDNRLLSQAQLEVLGRQLEAKRLTDALVRIEKMPLAVVRTARLSPLAFPLWAERLQSQIISSESWLDRVKRMAARLEQAAA